MRKNLIEWQWSDYFVKHRNRTNLVVHIFAVPLFWVGACYTIQGFFNFTSLLAGAAALLISFTLQGVGHKLEKETPAPFNSPFDFISRFLTEQFITFPRFILTGEWTRSFRKP